MKLDQLVLFLPRGISNSPLPLIVSAMTGLKLPHATRSLNFNDIDAFRWIMKSLPSIKFHLTLANLIEFPSELFRISVLVANLLITC